MMGSGVRIPLAAPGLSQNHRGLKIDWITTGSPWRRPYDPGRPTVSPSPIANYLLAQLDGASSDKIEFHRGPSPVLTMNPTLNQPVKSEMTPTSPIAQLDRATAFQADDEGSIPFTRSNDFNNLAAACHNVSTPVGCYVSTFGPFLFAARILRRPSRRASSAFLTASISTGA
jgi:hypothetical protein